MDKIEEINQHEYRLKEMNKIKEYIENERDVRVQIREKYHKASNVTLGIEMVLISLGIGLDICGVGLLSTIIAASVVVPLEVVGTVLGLAGLLAESKVITITDLISRAITNGQVSEHELKLVLPEISSYNDMKEDIRSKCRNSNSESIDFTKLIKIKRSEK